MANQLSGAGMASSGQLGSPQSPSRLRAVLTNLLLGVTLLVLMGVGILVTAQVGYLDHDDTGTAQGMLVLVITLLVIVALLLLRIASLGRERVEELYQRNRQLELEREQSEQLAVADERARIAREMHDIVAHSLTVIIAMSDGAAASIEKNPQLAKQALETMGDTGRQALADTRRLVGVLRTPTEVPAPVDSPGPETPVASSLEEVRFTPSPDLAEVDDLVRRFQQAGLPVEYHLSGMEMPADGPLQLTVYRIVQESLTNILRHAPESTQVQVCLQVDADSIHIRVYNATSLAGITPSGGRGLVGMRERAAVYDGHVEAGPTPDRLN